MSHSAVAHELLKPWVRACVFYSLGFYLLHEGGHLVGTPHDDSVDPLERILCLDGGLPINQQR